MATLLEKIYNSIEKNPHKDETLRWREPIPTEGSTLEAWDSFSVRPLHPPGLLSLLLVWTDPMYELGTPALRTQIYRETLLHLQERVDKELIGRQYPRKKIQDLLANQLTTQTPQSSPILASALCQLFQVQLVHLDRRSKSITFSPSDPRVWSSDKPTYVTGEDNQWLFTPLHSFSLKEWFEQKEKDGWKVSWPTADGKYEELKAVAVQKNLLSATSPKAKKDELALILGRNQSLLQLSSCQLSTW